MKERINNGTGYFKLSTKWIFTKSEKLKAPIKIAETDTNFIFFSFDFVVLLALWYYYNSIVTRTKKESKT